MPFDDTQLPFDSVPQTEPPWDASGPRWVNPITFKPGVKPPVVTDAVRDAHGAVQIIKRTLSPDEAFARGHHDVVTRSSYQVDESGTPISNAPAPGKVPSAILPTRPPLQILPQSELPGPRRQYIAVHPDNVSDASQALLGAGDKEPVTAYRYAPRPIRPNENPLVLFEQPDNIAVAEGRIAALKRAGIFHLAGEANQPELPAFAKQFHESLPVKAHAAAAPAAAAMADPITMPETPAENMSMNEVAPKTGGLLNSIPAPVRIIGGLLLPGVAGYVASKMKSDLKMAEQARAGDYQGAYDTWNNEDSQALKDGGRTLLTSLDYASGLHEARNGEAKQGGITFVATATSYGVPLLTGMATAPAIAFDGIVAVKAMEVKSLEHTSDMLAKAGQIKAADVDTILKAPATEIAQLKQLRDGKAWCIANHKPQNVDMASYNGGITGKSQTVDGVTFNSGLTVQYTSFGNEPFGSGINWGGQVMMTTTPIDGEMRNAVRRYLAALTPDEQQQVLARAKASHVKAPDVKGGEHHRDAPHPGAQLIADNQPPKQR